LTNWARKWIDINNKKKRKKQRKKVENQQKFGIDETKKGSENCDKSRLLFSSF
jgi:hypothetical protein